MLMYVSGLAEREAKRARGPKRIKKVWGLSVTQYTDSIPPTEIDT
jgi:hypothetical protein